MKIVYYSLSGNTKRMAELIAEGMKMAGKDAELVEFDSITAEELSEEEVIILGCPASGSEVLEEGTVDPFVDSLAGMINGKKTALFGSYGWGDGEWMKDWEERMESYGAKLVDDGLIVNEMPEGEYEQLCINFGKKIVSAMNL